MLCESAIHAYASSNLVSSKATARKVATPSFTMDKSKHTHTHTHMHSRTHAMHLLLISSLLFEAVSRSSLYYCVSQTSAARFLSVWRGKEVEWKKGFNRPLRPHGSGRRAVGQEPAGLSRAYLWSAFSSAVWGAARSGPSAPPPLALLVSLAVRAPLLRKAKNKRARLTLSALIFPLLLFQNLLSQTIYTGGVHTWKGITPFYRNEAEASGHISRAVHHWL